MGSDATKQAFESLFSDWLCKDARCLIVDGEPMLSHNMKNLKISWGCLNSCAAGANVRCHISVDHLMLQILNHI